MLYLYVCFFFFFFNDTATTEIYTLSLHDALPICRRLQGPQAVLGRLQGRHRGCQEGGAVRRRPGSAEGRVFRECARDRKSTRLNSSHLVISYAVFCLKKKKKRNHNHTPYTDLATS